MTRPFLFFNTAESRLLNEATLVMAGSNPTATELPIITLTEVESHLFGLLKEAAAQVGQGTVLRVAGGWVRDKLLGKESDDVDIALDNVSGASFAELLNKYLQDKGLETRSIGVIQANPEQSKHLETARVHVLGHWIDFTNLRTETYRADSRIPEISFGTAVEDASRRDFTINSLFYNLQTELVEDWTGQGLADLLGPAGAIRTPLPALTTFLDDPLRLLRAIRFSSRFALPLDANIVAAAENEELQHALFGKVSRERVGLEVEGILSGKDARPAVALEMLVNLGLSDVVFWMPEEVKTRVLPVGGMEGWAQRGLANVRMANALLMEREKPGIWRDIAEGGTEGSMQGAQGSIQGFMQVVRATSAYMQPRREYRLCFLAAMLAPWEKHCMTEERKPVEKKIGVVQWFVREALKHRAKDAEDLTALFGALDRCQSLTETMGAWSGQARGQEGRKVLKMQPGDACGTRDMERRRSEEQDNRWRAARLEAGRLVRDLKGLWRTGLDVACARECASLKGGENPTTESPSKRVCDISVTLKALYEVSNRYQHTIDAVQDMGLDGIWNLRPLLDGKAVISNLGLPKGPLVGAVMDAQIEWQLQYPGGNAEELTKHLQTLVAEGVLGTRDEDGVTHKARKEKKTGK